MSNTTEMRSVPTYLFYSRPGSITPPTSSLHLPTRLRHTCRLLSLPSALSLSRTPPRTPSHPILLSPARVDAAISLIENRLEQLDIRLTKIYPFKAQGLRYAPSRYLVEFAQFTLNCHASSNTSPNWEATLTIFIQKYGIQRKDASSAEVDRYRRVVQTLIDTAYEPDLPIALFRDEGIKEDIWARGMSGTAGYGGLRPAVGSSGKRAKLPKYVGNLVPKILGSLGSEALDQVNSDWVWAALADFFDLQRFRHRHLGRGV